VANDDLGAFVTDSPVGPPTGDGPLSGVDAAVKDCFAFRGHTSSFGIGRWRETHDPATSNSSVVTRLSGAGAQIVGLAKLDQLAFSLVGNASEGPAPRNPRHPDLYTGGSSSGSAAAVAGGRAALGVGTDTAGSVRVPAALCGIHGLRPTWGSIDMAGCLPLAPSFDTCGLLAANPLVMARALQVLAPRPASSAPIRRVMVDPSLAAPDATPLVEGARVVAQVVGATLETVSVAHLVNHDVGALLSRVQGREVWQTLGDWATRNADALDADVARRLSACRGFAEEDDATVEVDLTDRRLFTELLAQVVPPDTVLVTPTLGVPLPRIDSPLEDLGGFRRSTVALMAPASLSGWPQLTWSPARLQSPGGAVGLLARPGSDDALVDLLARLSSHDHGDDRS